MQLKSERLTLLIVTILLCLLGLFFVFQASAVESLNRVGDPYHQFRRQLVGLVIGAVGLVIAWKIPTKWYLKFAWPLYIGGILLTIMAFIPAFQSSSNLVANANRWISIFGVFSLQTVEVVKLCLVVFFGFLLSRKVNLISFAVFAGIPIGLILLQRDLGSLLVVGVCLLGMYFLAGARVKDMAFLGVAAMMLAIFAVFLPGGSGSDGGGNFRTDRVEVFLYVHTGRETEADTWHVDQLLMGLGRGGAFGQGIGNSRQRYAFIPETSTDSIFAIVGEEVGFVGSTFVILLYLFFFYLIFRIVTLAELDKAERLIGYGILVLFAGQIFLNIAAISSLTPLTGITLPFFSFGSSSLIMSLVLVGVILGLGVDVTPQFLVKNRKSRVIKK
ncbi:MAG: FtsW/RodA/SpoVE family cell cycle protein [Pseudomonadales bacterium]|jgi:cell division protein FtsW|nr:FtsW/RodA/SpoVE family cell cycle protein [Pseudomonadales bacterium]